MPPLIKAAGLGRLNMVKRLLENGADPLAVTPRGESALEKAKLFDQWEVVEYLEDYYKTLGANPPAKSGVDQKS